MSSRHGVKKVGATRAGARKIVHRESKSLRKPNEDREVKVIGPKKQKLTRETANSEAKFLYNPLDDEIYDPDYMDYGVTAEEATTNLQETVCAPSSSDTQSSYLNSWLPRRPLFLEALFQQHASPANNAGCATSYMTEPLAYQSFLKGAIINAPRFQQKPTCNDHNVTKHANRRNANLDITGIAAHACARHGCFAPSSVVDLQKGERQMNIDYSLSEALKTTKTDGIKSLLLIYDVMCQYKVHLLERFEATPKHLEWPESIDIILTAIGKFHVHAHQDSCLYRYSPSYIPDAAVVAGEILESLWSKLNKISRTLRGASIQHRLEVLDDHMNDSNLKKIIHAAESICTRHTRALQGAAAAAEQLEAIKEGCLPQNLRKWEDEVITAEAARARGSDKAMDLMHSRVTKGMSKIELEVELTRKEVAGGAHGETSWLSLGLQIEEDQEVLRSVLAAPEAVTTANQQLSIQQRRLRLQRLLDTFHLGSRTHLDELLHFIAPIAGIGPEAAQLAFPSMIVKLPGIDLNTTREKRLRNKELKLRQGQANDLLQRLRETISHLSFQYLGNLRNQNGTRRVTRIWRGVADLNQELRILQLMYARCRDRMVALSSEAAVDATYRHVGPADCRSSELIYDPNARGLTDSGLSWIWGTISGNREDNKYLDEFYRLHFLRARARLNRWVEEIKLTKYELRWTIMFFSAKAREWRSYHNIAGLSAGHASFAAKQVAFWNSLGKAADVTALASIPDHVLTWNRTTL
ncbi:hypothetical protein CPB83DRAFT_892920 [Crepidotus variabilis]|uniref:Uncharacterized protein n=1 Tax=Crepidotus variabilis TaxID=179855 RepID=A0A9P6EJ27_9AGAR|nr:hypothetical protein CPB83DRAFT_892920 [Crepidotus variabilis]